jgi:hypothetical protein
LDVTPYVLVVTSVSGEAAASILIVEDKVEAEVMAKLRHQIDAGSHPTIQQLHNGRPETRTPHYLVCIINVVLMGKMKWRQ